MCQKIMAANTSKIRERWFFEHNISNSTSYRVGDEFCGGYLTNFFGGVVVIRNKTGSTQPIKNFSEVNTPDSLLSCSLPLGLDYVLSPVKTGVWVGAKGANRRFRMQICVLGSRTLSLATIIYFAIIVIIRYRQNSEA